MSIRKKMKSTNKAMKTSKKAMADHFYYEGIVNDEAGVHIIVVSFEGRIRPFLITSSLMITMNAICCEKRAFLLYT